MRIEINVMQSLNEKFMSDEEIDPEDGTSFKRSPPWWCEKLSSLIKNWIKDISRKKLKTFKVQRVGPKSGRPPPSNSPSWAIVFPATVAHAETDEVENTHMTLSASLETDYSITSSGNHM